MKRRTLILLFGGGSSGALTLGSGAFSSARMDRGVDVDVVPDDQALVGYSTPADGETVSEGDEIPLVRIENRFNESQNITVVGVRVERGQGSLDSDSYRVKRILSDQQQSESEGDSESTPVDHVTFAEGTAELDRPDGLDDIDGGFSPAGYEVIKAKVADIDPGEEVQIEVTVLVIGVDGDIAAQLFGDTRGFTIVGAESEGDDEQATSPADQVSGVNFKGESGRVRIETAGESPVEVRARVYYEEKKGNSTDVLRTDWRDDVATGSNVKLKDFGLQSEGPTIVGVEIDGIDGVFARSERDADGFVGRDATQSPPESAFDNPAWSTDD